MNSWKQVVSNFAKTRRALLAGLLGLGLAVLWSGVVFATSTAAIGPQAYIDSATDDGGGKIRITWSIESEPPSGYTYDYNKPDKACVSWAVVTDGVSGSFTSTCFTSEAANQDDLVVDTGIGGDGSKTVYSLILIPYYQSLPLYPLEDGVLRTTEVTLNASA